MPDQLIGRGEQLARVTAALAARDGHLVIEGESGAGKTAMLRATGGLAEERGYRVARAQAHRTEHAFPFGVVWQLLDPLLATVDEQAREELMSGAVAAGSKTDAADPALCHALRELAVRLAGPHPLLLAVDDVHWADPESLNWLAYVVREGAAIPIVVVVTHTPGTGPPAQTSLTGLLSGLDTVPLGGLGEDDIAALAAAVLGPAADQAFVQDCRQATDGNPFLVAEYLRAAAARDSPELVSRRVTRWVTSRIGQLSPSAIRLAQAIVILGEDAGLPAVAELADLDPGEAAALVESLTQMGFLISDGPGFAQRVVRTAVDQSIAPGERRVAHAKAAAILHEGRRPADQVAEHLLATGPLGRRWAAETLRTAANDALRRKAVTLAADYLRRALREPVDTGLRAELLAELGHAEMRTATRAITGAAAGIKAAIEHLAEAYELATELPFLAWVAEDLATAYHHDGALDRATQVLDQAVARLTPGHPDLAAGLDALGLAMVEPGGPYTERLERLQARAGYDADLARTVTAVRARHLMLAGGSGEAVAGARQVVEAGPPRTMRRLLEYQAAVGVLCSADQLTLAATCAADVIAQAAVTGLPGFAVLGHAMAARVAFQEGRNDEAVEEARTANGIQSVVNGRSHPSARLWELAALLVKGDEEAAAAILADIGPLGEAAPTRSGGPTGGTAPARPDLSVTATLSLRGLLREMRGEFDTALADHLESGRRLTAAGMVNPVLVPWRSRAGLLCHRLGRRDEALRLAAEELGLARRWGTARTIGVALRALGVAAGGPDGLSLLEESVSLLARSPARVEHAYALYDLGRVLGEAGRNEDARPLLHESYRLAGDCGAEPLAAWCATEIKKVGGRRPRARLAGAAALTAQERRIAERAAAGATNREIAEELFLTLRTVEAHLTAVYRKLGIEGRAQLSRRLT